jgi:hypothetical protein
LAVNQITGTSLTDAPAPATPPDAQPAPPSQPAGADPAQEPLGFRSRGGARRRARFLRKARELGYRDLGGLLFNLHRFGQRNDALVLAKLTTLGHIDTELHALEAMLHERRAVTVLREAGITACPRCAAIHSSEDNFCPNCGLSVGRHADLPIGAAAPAPATNPAPATSAPAPAPTPPAPAPPPSTPPTPPTPTLASPPPTPAAPPPAPTTGAPDPSPGGRSPSPPSAAPAATPRSQPPTAAEEDDGPTEILKPPAADA